MHGKKYKYTLSSTNFYKIEFPHTKLARVVSKLMQDQCTGCLTDIDGVRTDSALGRIGIWPGTSRIF